MQIPSVQLDSVVESSAALFVANRNPQPGEAQIPALAAIEFDVFGSIDELIISVDGVTVYQGGLFQNAWTGLVTAGPVSNSASVLLHTPNPFPSGSIQRVRVWQAARFTTWMFVAYDVIPPLIALVQAISAFQIKVTFNEPVYMGVDEPGDALNVASYSIENVSRPAVVPAVVRAEYASDTEVILTTDLECSFGADYLLVVTGIEDEFDNVFQPPNNVAPFIGYLPPYPARRRWLLHDFVPRMSLAEDDSQDLILFLGCLQDTNNILLYSIDSWIDIIDPDTAPESFVDAMLLDMGNPFDFELTLNQKRRLAKILVLIYKLKGTAPGIIDVVRFFLGIEVTIKTFVGEGWRIGIDQINSTTALAPLPAIVGPSGGALYSFLVHAEQPLTAIQKQQILSIARYMKGAPEHVIFDEDLPAWYRYWIVAKTKVGFARVGNGTTLPKEIVSFTVSLNEPKEITLFTLATP